MTYFFALLDIIVTGVLVLAGVYFGFSFAKGESPILPFPRKMKRVIRTEEEEEKLLTS